MTLLDIGELYHGSKPLRQPAVRQQRPHPAIHCFGHNNNVQEAQHTLGQVTISHLIPTQRLWRIYISGADDGVRTHDLLLIKHTLICLGKQKLYH